MEIKVKITYLDFYQTSRVCAKIIVLFGWYELSSKLSMFGISDNQIIKIERVLEASDEDTQVVS